MCKEKATNAYDFKLQTIQADATLRKVCNNRKYERQEVKITLLFFTKFNTQFFILSQD